MVTHKQTLQMDYNTAPSSNSSSFPSASVAFSYSSTGTSFTSTKAFFVDFFFPSSTPYPCAAA